MAYCCLVNLAFHHCSLNGTTELVTVGVTARDRRGVQAATTAIIMVKWASWKTVFVTVLILYGCVTGEQLNYVNTLRPRQNGRHFPDDIFTCIFLNENV